VELPVILRLLKVNRVLLVEVSYRHALSFESTFLPEARSISLGFSSGVSIVVHHFTEVAVMGVTSEEVVNERGDTVHSRVSSRERVLVGRSLNHSEHLFGGIMFVTLEHEVTGEAIVHAVSNSDGDVTLVDGSELFDILMESVNDTAVVDTLL